MTTNNQVILNNLLGKTVNDTILLQNINPNQIMQPNFNPLIKEDTMKNIKLNNLNNNKIQNDIKKTNNTKIINIGKKNLQSSGKLLISSRSSKYNKVLKNGKKIKNIDINSDYEGMPKEDDDSVSINLNIKNRSTSNGVKNKLNFSTNDVKNLTEKKIVKENKITNTSIHFNGNQLIQSIKQNGDATNKRETIKNITSLQLTNDDLTQDTKKTKNQVKIKKIEKLTPKKNVKQNRSTKVKDNKINNELNQKINKSSILDDKSSDNLNKSVKGGLSNSQINKDSKKKEDDNISKRSESNNNNQSNMTKIISANNSNFNNNKLYNNNIYSNQSENYIINHLGEYMQNQINPIPLIRQENLSDKTPKGFRFCSELTKAGKSVGGSTKINQDTPLICLSIGGITGFNLFGVLDGHGPHGHYVSQFCKEYFIKKMTNYTELLKTTRGISTPEQIYNNLKIDRFNYIIELYNKSDTELVTQDNFDYTLSGTTCNIVFQFNSHLVCFSVGDSRGILIYDKGNSLNEGIFLLSIDHKPDLPSELERIESHGGIVDKIEDMYGNKLGPSRVFKAGFNSPGLAMSRSLGDLEAKECGVISTPQIIEYNINNNSKYMVICSDGVWEFASNEQVRDIGNIFYKKNDASGFCSELIEYSVGLWEQNEIIRDDITVVSVFF